MTIQMSKINIEKREHEMKLQNALIITGQFPSCVSCEEWHKENQSCMLYKMLPPAEVIATGCVNYQQTIPF